MATLAIVAGTFVSVLGTTILNVPIDAIARDLRVSIADITLLITAQSVAFAAFLPVGGWLGNRFGRKRVYCVAVTTLAVAGLIAMGAQSLGLMVAMRIVQGLASAAIVPLVMTLLSDLYEPERRPLALSAWAMANSLGQALGPPLGGVLTVLLGWRSIFAPAPIVAVLACAAALRYLPADPARPQPLEWHGALGLTAGAVLLLIAVSAVPHAGLSPFVLAIAAGGLAATAVFVRAIRTTAHPFVSPQAFRERSYVTSCIGVVAATVALGAALLAIPLYLERALGYATDTAGFITFALPLAMALIAPLTSVVVKRWGAIASLHVGLVLLIVASAGTAWCVAGRLSFAPLVPFLLVFGAVLALQYTAGAVGTTQTAAGRYGAGIGFFNTLRIGGSAVGAALVGTILERAPDAYAVIFTGTGVAAAVALAAVLGLRGAVPAEA